MAEKTKLAALFVSKESTFGTDPSSDGSGYKFIKASEMVFQPMIDVVERPGLVNDLVRQAHVLGAKAGSISFKLEMKGSGTAASDNVAAIAAEADPILDCLFGTVTRQSGDTVQSGGSTTTIVVSAGSRFSKYGMIMVDCGATYGYVARFITGIATNTLTVDRALPVSAATLTGNNVYASTKYSRANSGHASMAFVGVRGAIQYTFVGCKIDSAKIAGVNARGTGILEVTVSVSDWTSTSKASLPSTVLSGITAVKGPVIKASALAVGGTEELVFGLDLNFNHKFVFQDATSALGTSQPDSANASVQLVDAAPEGTVKSYYKSAHLTDFAAGTQQSLAFAAIDAPTAAGAARAWGMYAINTQWLQPTFGDHNGMVDQTLPFRVNDNSTDPEYVLCVA